MSSSSLGDLANDASYFVVVCRRCQSCLVPGGGRVERHLRGLHRLLGKELKALVAYATVLKLRNVSALKREKPREPVAPLVQLQIRPRFRCLLCGPNEAFHTTHLPRMRDHVPSRHERSAREHKSTPMWRSCLLQTYFTARALIDYFPVSAGQQVAREGACACGWSGDGAEPLEDLFAQLEGNAAAAKQEAIDRGCDQGVEDFDSRMLKVPWLQRYLYWNPFLRRKMELGVRTQAKYVRAPSDYGGRPDFLGPQDEHAR